MGRFGIAIGMLACALGSAQPARALSEQCTEPLTYEPRGDQAYPATPISTAALEAIAVVVPSTPSASDDDEELPWCVSPEDPRCSPLPGHSAPSELAVRGFAAPSSLPTTPTRSSFGVAQQSGSNAGLMPASGVHDRLERPPRS